MFPSSFPPSHLCFLSFAASHSATVFAVDSAHSYCNAPMRVRSDSNYDGPQVCSPDIEARDTKEQPTDASVASRLYLCYFMHRLLDFRQPEVRALAAMAGCCLESRSDTCGFKPPFGGSYLSPFWYLRLPSEAIAQRLLQRSLLVKVLQSSMLALQCLVDCCIYAQLLCTSERDRNLGRGSNMGGATSNFEGLP